jgi:hypothetical protein
MMEIVIRPRLGIGLDIEHNEEICYRAEEEKSGKEVLLCYVGILLKVPFLTIYIGEFMDRRDMADD